MFSRLDHIGNFMIYIFLVINLIVHSKSIEQMINEKIIVVRYFIDNSN